MREYRSIFKLSLIILLLSGEVSGQSVARVWNEALLEGIRNDYARPTVHARNLFHISAAMYDSWAAYDANVSTYFLGHDHNNQLIPFLGIPAPANAKEAREETMSYACYRLMKSRFRYSPGLQHTFAIIDHIMDSLGYDINYQNIDYSNGSPAALGNYIAEKIIDFGLNDGSNERDDYANIYYTPVNSPLLLNNPLEPNGEGGPNIADPNRWQPLAFETFIDQAGNEIPGNIPEFLSPEWGNVIPFSLTDQDKVAFSRDNSEYHVYYDPGAPAYLERDGGQSSDEYKWNFSMVSIWGAHLNPDENVFWDISPASIGNIDIENFPQSIPKLREFYGYLEGGDPGAGYSVNPKTGLPYEPQLVKRGDYARVLAEFWADGPDSETPPGHWFTILNYVNDHTDFKKRFKGTGPEFDDLEWDVKAYFALGGAMHDAAIAAWSIKGYYDYVRPISAIRYMANKGQSTDPELASYHPEGIPLVEGYIELIGELDDLAGDNNEHVGKIKLYTWRGHNFITDPKTDVAGVGWILAQNWMPYQRPTFVTPPFAGYVSGHSTYSRAAAKVLTLLTGDEYFPGGLGEFLAGKNNFLVFEDGPSDEVILQWAKYYDASDQCSLSRIWGGIHPPVDDIPGRLIGDKVGEKAFNLAEKYFDGEIITDLKEHLGGRDNEFKIYPNPIIKGQLTIQVKNINTQKDWSIQIMDISGRFVRTFEFNGKNATQMVLDISKLPDGYYVLGLKTQHSLKKKAFIVK